jgi:hypothetical protein
MWYAGQVLFCLDAQLQSGMSAIIKGLNRSSPRYVQVNACMPLCFKHTAW